MLQHRVYTWPEFLPREGEWINALFEKGLPCLHVRKPQSSWQEGQALLRQIEPVYHARIILHQHWDLGADFGVGGGHWTEAQRANHPDFEQTVLAQQAQGWQVGTAIHHPQQLASLPSCLDYVTVSPIFESISKPNYKASYTWEDHGKHPYTLVALGGITPSNLAAVQARGFKAVALLGAIWQPSTSIIDNYQQLCLALQQL